MIGPVPLLPGEVVRALRPGEEDDFLRILCAAFGLDAESARPLFHADPFFDLSHKRVLWTPDAGILSVLTVIPSTLHVGQSLVPMGGIAGVATHPEAQGQGAATRLLSATLAELDTHLPYTVAALFAVNRPFYRHLGWEDASRIALWRGSPRHTHLGTNEERQAVTVRPATPADRLHIHALHARLTEKRTGAAERDSRRWYIIDVMAPARQTWVYEGKDGSVQGYVLCDRMDTEQPAYRIVELLADGDGARRALRSFLERPPLDAQAWEWPVALSELMSFELNAADADEELEPAEEPGIMLRICHAPRALALRHAADFLPHFSGGQSLTLLVRDSLLPENEVPIVINARGVHTGPPVAAQSVSLSIGTLAQLYMGYYSASDAAASGLLTASTSAALELADRLFPSLSPCVLPADQF